MCRLCGRLRGRSFAVLILLGVLVLLLWSWNSHQSDKESNPGGGLNMSYISNGENVVIGPFATRVHGSTDLTVTLATHSSPKHLHKLQVLLDAWQGPVTLAIWLHAEIKPVLEFAELLTKHCFPDRDLAITLVLPAASVKHIDLALLGRSLSAPDCSRRSIHNELYRLMASDQRPNYESAVPYPNNKLRNVALSMVKSPYVLVTDIDVVPSVSVHKGLVNFLADQHFEQMAYVLPVFESMESGSHIWTLERLMQAWSAGVVRPFYEETCPQCQGPTQYTLWKDASLHPQDEGGARCRLLRYVPGWEPFVVTKTAKIPNYDTRFHQYGFNRVSQVCEMHMAGFTFCAVDSLFLVHDGFKTEDGFHNKKEEELDKSRALYKQFRVDMKSKYVTERNCD